MKCEKHLKSEWDALGKTKWKTKSRRICATCRPVAKKECIECNNTTRVSGMLYAFALGTNVRIVFVLRVSQRSQTDLSHGLDVTLVICGAS